MKFVKKSFLPLLIILLFAGNHANAQFFYGVKGGATLSKLGGGDTYGGMNYKFGPTGGITMGFKIKTDLNIQGEILYSDWGVEQKYIIQETIETVENDSQKFTNNKKVYNNSLDLTYVHVPLMIKKSFSLKGGIYPYKRAISSVDIDFFGGPYVSYLLSSGASMSTRVYTTETLGTTTTDYPERSGAESFGIGQDYTFESFDTNQYSNAYFADFEVDEPSSSSGMSSIDVGIVFGAGISFEVSQLSKLTFGARYGMGLLSIDKEFFNNVTYTFTPNPNGSADIGGNKFAVSETRTKMDLRNQVLSFHIGFIHYID